MPFSRRRRPKLLSYPSPPTNLRRRRRRSARISRRPGTFIAWLGIAAAIGWLVAEHAGIDLLAPVPSLSIAQDAEAIRGPVTHVRDGDTIEVDRVPIRLQGVSAPELGTAAGEAGKRFMIDLVHGRTVTCSDTGERSYDRVIGICRLNGRDIGQSIVAAGLARDCPRYSGGRYADAEAMAPARPELRGYELPGYCR